MTVEQVANNVVLIVGALGLVATLLGSILPKRWRVTEILARWGADVRKIRLTEKEYLSDISKDIESRRVASQRDSGTYPDNNSAA